MGKQNHSRISADRGILALVDVMVQLLQGGRDDSRASRRASGHHELASVDVLDDRRADGALGALARSNKVDLSSQIWSL